MNKKFLIFFILSTIFATSMYALDIKKTYISNSFALESESTKVESGLAVIVNAGYIIKKRRAWNIAIEGEITYTLYPTIEHSYSQTTDSKYLTLASYSVFKYNINKKFFIKPRVGFIYQSKTDDITYLDNTTKTNSSNKVSFSYGIAGGYKLTQQFDIVLSYNLLDRNNLSHVSVGVIYNF